MIEDIKFPDNEIAQEKYDVLRRRLLERARVLEEKVPKHVEVFRKTGNPMGADISALLLDCLQQCNDFYELEGMIAKRNKQLESQIASLKDELLVEVRVLVERLKDRNIETPVKAESNAPTPLPAVGGVPAAKTYFCSVCGDRFTASVLLAAHVRSKGHQVRRSRRGKKHFKPATVKEVATTSVTTQDEVEKPEERDEELNLNAAKLG